MQTLSNVSFNEIRIGDRVKSKVTNREGFISRITPIEYARRFEDNEFIIVWENGNISCQWHFMYDFVWLM